MRKLNDWLKTYMQYTQYSEAPEAFHFWTGVGTIAGALRRKVRIKELYYEWSPNFYIIFVAKPGIATKSTSIAIGRRLLEEVKGVKFGPDAITWQALISTLAAAREDVPLPDGTFEPMSCLTFTASEFGTLIDFKDRQMLNVLVDLWDGKDGAFSKVTKTVPSDLVPNPWLNIISATTPAWLADNLPRQMLQGGFTSRCLFIFGDKKRQLVPYPSRLVNISKIQKISDDLIHDLEQIAMLRGEVTLTEEAYKYGEKWYIDHNKKALHASEDLGGYMSRKQVHVHKLATVLSAAKSDSLVITAEDLAIAEKLLSALEADMFNVFRLIQTTEPMEKVSRLVNLVRSNGSVKKAELYRIHFMNQMSFKDFQDAINSAVAAGALIEMVQGAATVLSVPGKPVGTGGR